MKTHTATVRSFTPERYGTEYKVELHDTGAHWCSCPAQRNFPDKRPCKHIRFILGQRDAEAMKVAAGTEEKVQVTGTMNVGRKVQAFEAWVSVL